MINTDNGPAFGTACLYVRSISLPKEGRFKFVQVSGSCTYRSRLDQKL